MIQVHGDSDKDRAVSVLPLLASSSPGHHIALSWLEVVCPSHLRQEGGDGAFFFFFK